MASLGKKFGTPREPLDVDFDYFGTMIRLNPGLTRKPLVTFGRTVQGFDEKDPDLDLMENATDELLRSVLHPEDFEQFKAVAAVHRQELEDLVDVAVQLVEAVAEVPTVRPSGSSDGPTSTGPSSEGVSSSPDIARLEMVGRSDLAYLKRREQEFLSA